MSGNRLRRDLGSMRDVGRRYFVATAGAVKNAAQCLIWKSTTKCFGVTVAHTRKKT
jgi:hypothetical protein